MENYLINYDNLDKIIIYDFKLGSGGIGDCIKYFMYTLCLCIKYNIKLYYLKNNILLENFLKLKYDKMYISIDNIKNSCNITENDIPNISSDIHNIVLPFIYYNSFLYKYITIPIEEIFYFNDDVKINSNIFLSKDINNYISIHLRMGDKYLETDKEYVLCIDDERLFNEDKLFNFIENNIYNNNIIFFCDNYNYKIKIKNKYNNIIILDYEIGHTSLSNTTYKQTLDTITEFYIMTNSNKIFCVTESGFSIISSKFKNIPLEYI
jgi:hypothetical protein